MTDQLLGILNVALLALLYLFFARVLWAVWSEVRGPRQRAGAEPGTAPVVDGTPHATVMPAAAAAPGQKPPKGRRGRVARLAIIEPRARRGHAFAVDGGVTIGRAPGCTITIPDDAFVSQLHARIVTVNGNVIVEDLGSTNGTYVNTRRVGSVPVTLSKGDRVQIGNTVLEAQ